MIVKHSIQCIASLLVGLLLGTGSVVLAGVPIGYFTDVKPVPGLESPYLDESPSLTPDELTVFFDSTKPFVGESATSDIWMATRESKSDPFGEWVNLGPPVSEDGVGEGGPHLSADTRHSRYYASWRPDGLGEDDIWVSVRESLDGAWQEPVNLGTNVNSTSNEFSPALSTDELTLYFTSNRNGELAIFQAKRNSIGEEFGPAERLENIHSVWSDKNPTISADGLTLFYDSYATPDPYQSLWVATRSSTDEPFGNPVDLNDFSFGSNVNAYEAAEFTPYISRDWPASGSKIYFARATVENDYDIYEATWVASRKTSREPVAIHTAIDNDFDGEGDEVYDRGEASRSSVGVQSNTVNRLLTKFELPGPGGVGQLLEKATLRFFLEDMVGTPAGAVSVFRSLTDNKRYSLESDYEDDSYEDTQLNLVQTDSPDEQYYEVDVTDLVREDYAADGDNPISAFRLQINELVFEQEGRYRFTMPGAEANHPELVLTFIPEASTGLLAAIGLFSLFTCGRRRRSEDG